MKLYQAIMKHINKPSWNDADISPINHLEHCKVELREDILKISTTVTLTNLNPNIGNVNFDFFFQITGRQLQKLSVTTNPQLDRKSEIVFFDTMFNSLNADFIARLCNCCREDPIRFDSPTIAGTHVCKPCYDMLLNDPKLKKDWVEEWNK